MSPAQCRRTRTITINKKSALPRGVIETFSFAIAEKNEPFNEGDALLPGTENRPFARFMSASLRGCTLDLTFERGGIALRIDRRTLRWSVDSGWRDVGDKLLK